MGGFRIKPAYEDMYFSPEEIPKALTSWLKNHGEVYLEYVEGRGYIIHHRGYNGKLRDRKPTNTYAEEKQNHEPLCGVKHDHIC